MIRAAALLEDDGPCLVHGLAGMTIPSPCTTRAVQKRPTISHGSCFVLFFLPNLAVAGCGCGCCCCCCCWLPCCCCCGATRPILAEFNDHSQGVDSDVINAFTDTALVMFRERIAAQAEVIRAIVLEDVPPWPR